LAFGLLTVVLKLVLLAAVIIAGLPYVETARLSPATRGSPGSIVAAGMAIFVAFAVAFELSYGRLRRGPLVTQKEG